MNAGIGNGWNIVHLTDRVCELAKDSYEYRKFTGHDGYVRVRAEQGMDRHLLIERALMQANRSDAELALRVAADNLPTGKALADFRIKTRAMARANHTGEESFAIGVHRV